MNIIPPAEYDGFGMHRVVATNTIQCDFLLLQDRASRVSAPAHTEVTVPQDRQRFHVLLSSVRRGRVYIETPFVSNFLDPFVYATHMVNAGFSCIMLKYTQYSEHVAGLYLEELQRLFLQGSGFVMDNAQGVSTFYAGAKKETVRP